MKCVLPDTQSRILLVLLLDSRSTTSSTNVLKATAICYSTWNREKRLLESIGLIVSENTKDFTQTA